MPGDEVKINSPANARSASAGQTAGRIYRTQTLCDYNTPAAANRQAFTFTNGFTLPWYIVQSYPGEYTPDQLVDAALSPEKKEAAMEWVRDGLLPRKTPTPYRSSYGMKQQATRELGFWFSDTTFKDVLLLCGFTPVDMWARSWRYCISKMSPAFHRNAA